MAGVSVLIPAALFGTEIEVQRRVVKLASRIKQGEDLIAVVTEGGMLDTERTLGHVVIGGCRPRQCEDFHCYQLWKRLTHELYPYQFTPVRPAPLEDQLFAASLTAPWGVLGLIAPENRTWMRPERFERFVTAIHGMWSELCGLGERYFWDRDGEAIWAVPSNLHFVLANLGVPNRKLNSPLPGDGLRGLFTQLPVAS
ncbi:MAG TPA: hypothetical protein VFP84_31405 [Kofleriaceae bacterium]|nr:hypothetical protein [Kofleriaceae bacterium]